MRGRVVWCFPVSCRNLHTFTVQKLPRPRLSEAAHLFIYFETLLHRIITNRLQEENPNLSVQIFLGLCAALPIPGHRALWDEEDILITVRVDHEPGTVDKDQKICQHITGDNSPFVSSHPHPSYRNKCCGEFEFYPSRALQCILNIQAHIHCLQSIFDMCPKSSLLPDHPVLASVYYLLSPPNS